MLIVGSHISSAGGYKAMAKQAQKLGANTFAFFTRNPRGGAAKAIVQADVDAFLEYASALNLGKIVAHAPYTLNAAAVREDIRTFANNMFADDLKRLAYTPGNYYNFHPGSHVGQGMDVGIEWIVKMLNDNLTQDMQTTVLLETMAGKGSEVGSRFEELRAIIDGVQFEQHMGVCLDTCHVWDAGYDIVAHLDDVLAEFDRVVGLSRLKAMHLNDSLNPLGAHKDRHAKIGEGHIGLDAFARIINHPALKGVPMVLETPNDDAGWAQEITLLRSLEQ